MSTVLLTGFGAYADQANNPSGAIATHLNQQLISDALVVGCVLPVRTELVRDALRDAMERAQPDVIIITGVTAGRTAPALERVAINVRDFPMPDADGRAPIDEPIDPQGPCGYFSTLPIKAIAEQWRQAGIPGYISNTAGTYVCNQTFYLARHLTEGTTTRTGLLHLPSQPRQVPEMGSAPPASMSLDSSESAVRVAISTALNHQGPDLAIAAGSTG